MTCVCDLDIFQAMRPKNDLLIFSKKEIFVILLLLVLVALFSFTIGVRLGKRLAPVGVATVASGEKPPLESAHLEEEHEAESAVAHSGEHSESTASTSEKLSHKAQDIADAQLAEQTTEQKVASGKEVPMKFPASKVAKHLYTLQVGSHKSVAEAANQVTELKRKSLDAFYMQAAVPGVGTRYRVAVGKYASKEAAETAGTEMKKAQQLPDFIIQKVTEGAE